MRWAWKRAEERASSYEGLVTDAIVAAADSPGNADGLAAIEAAAGLIGRCFAAADVSEDRFSLVQPWALEMIGRELVRRGECIFSIEGEAMPRLAPVGTWDLLGGDDPATWFYRLNVHGATTMRTRVRLAPDVVHCRVNADPLRPWLGRASHRIASTTAGTAASAERSAGAEARTPSARIAPVPTPDEAQRTTYAGRLQKGGVVAVQAAASPVAGAGQEPASRWAPSAMRPDPTNAHVDLRSSAARDVLSAIGIPSALFDARADGTTRREAYRQLVLVVVQPWARLVTAELRAKLDSPGLSLGFKGLHGADLATRGRALKTMADAGVPLSDALEICDLGPA